MEEANEKLSQLAAYDSLTGLLNRREFEKRVSLEFSRMRRYDRTAAILLLDIDYFKRVNDQHGHPAGDALLQQFAAVLNNALREIDVIARWGGEEFIALLPATEGDDAVLVAERIRATMEKHAFQVGRQSLKITASIGVSEMWHRDAEPFRQAYERADNAVYSAKDGGRNRVVFATRAGTMAMDDA